MADKFGSGYTGDDQDTRATAAGLWGGVPGADRRRRRRRRRRQLRRIMLAAAASGGGAPGMGKFGWAAASAAVALRARPRRRRGSGRRGPWYQPGVGGDLTLLLGRTGHDAGAGAGREKLPRACGAPPPPSSSWAGLAAPPTAASRFGKRGHGRVGARLGHGRAPRGGGAGGGHTAAGSASGAAPGAAARAAAWRARPAAPVSARTDVRARAAALAASSPQMGHMGGLPTPGPNTGSMSDAHAGAGVRRDRLGLLHFGKRAKSTGDGARRRRGAAGVKDRLQRCALPHSSCRWRRSARRAAPAHEAPQQSAPGGGAPAASQPVAVPSRVADDAVDAKLQ